MEYIKYLDLPLIPKYLLEPLDVLLTKPINPHSSVSPLAKNFKEKKASDELNNWLKDNINFYIDASPNYMLINRNITIHRDVDNYNKQTQTKGRTIALNYLINPGGKNVYTTIYNEDKKTILQTEKIEPFRWHYITVDRYHGIHGIDETDTRVNLSITFKDEKIFKEYCLNV